VCLKEMVSECRIVAVRIRNMLNFCSKAAVYAVNGSSYSLLPCPDSQDRESRVQGSDLLASRT
jgi:hypothetical protein